MISIRKPLAMALLASVSLVNLMGCESKEDKVNRILEDRVATCKTSQETFHEVELFDGTDEILTEACSMTLEPPNFTDEFHAVAKTGPYHWLFGLDDAIGVWNLTSVSFDPITDARKVLEMDEPDADMRKRAEEKLVEAQKGLPDSAWVRVNRVENALQLRTLTRRKDKENPTSLGDAQKVVDENLAWAKEKDKAALAKMNLALIDHWNDYTQKLEGAMESMGSQDDWYAASIRQSLKEGNKEDAANYQAELDKMIAERPAVRERNVNRLAEIFDQRCKAVAALSAEGIEDAKLKELVVARKSAVKCNAEARPKLEDYEQAAEEE